MANEKRRVTLNLPAEFVELCEYDMVAPEKVLRNFIADVCSIDRIGDDPMTDVYLCNSGEACQKAKLYYRWRDSIRVWQQRHE